jgi:hypothetical protein
MEEKRIVITGATGMVDRLAFQMCLDSPDVSRVTAMGRRPFTRPAPGPPSASSAARAPTGPKRAA